MPSIEVGSKWKMHNGEVMTVTGMLVTPFDVSVICTSDQYGGQEHWKAAYLVRHSEKQPDVLS